MVSMLLREPQDLSSTHFRSGCYSLGGPSGILKGVETLDARGLYYLDPHRIEAHDYVVDKEGVECMDFNNYVHCVILCIGWVT